MLSLMINVGKSSIKYKLFNGDKEVKSATIDQIGKKILNHTQAWEMLCQSLGVDVDNIEVVGHKLPVGTEKYANLVSLNSAILEEIKKSVEVSPFAATESLQVAALAMPILAKAKHYAIFDDGFYHNLPEVTGRYAISLENKFVKRGGQGISHQYVLHQAQKELGMIRTQRMISVHLGDSCSVCALMDGNCVDVSGGSAADGLMGMSQVGEIDGGIILTLLKEGKTVEEIETLLGTKSGVLGISGLSDDMRDILYLAGYKVDDENYVPAQDLPKDEESINKCRLAIEMFAYRIVRYIGAYIAVLGGLDSLAFTGAIGARSSEIRSLILSKLDFVKEDHEIIIVQPDEEEQMRLMLGNHLQNTSEAQTVSLVGSQ